MVTIVIKNKTGLHARPAAVFVNEAQKFESEIEIIKGGSARNAKSIMNLMSMAIVSGDEISISANGVDAVEAEQHLASILDNIQD